MTRFDSVESWVKQHQAERHHVIFGLAAILVALLFVVAQLAGCFLVPTGSAQETTTPGGGTSPAQTSSGQTGLDPTESGDPAENLQLIDYFPLTPDVFLDYDGTGNEYVPMTVWVEYVTDETIQMSYDNGGTEVHRLYRISEGQVRQIASLPELYVREDLSLREPDEAGEVLLQAPLMAGTSWTLNDGRIRRISALDVPVTTPAGDFSALEVTTDSDSGVMKQYYAPGVGLVQMTFTGDYEISQVLRQRLVPRYRSVPMTFYYGRLTARDSEMVSKTIDAEFRTNIGIREVLTRYFREPAAPDLPPLISQNTVINDVRLDPVMGVVTIDFSPELVTEMNAGSTFEALVIRSIVNTVGMAYGVEQVAITLDQRPYESGHIAIGPGEYFGVDLDGVIQLP